MRCSVQLFYVKYGDWKCIFKSDKSLKALTIFLPYKKHLFSLLLQSCRLYATKHLRVLLRANVEFFSNWGIELLVTQLHDKNKTISSEALDILDEACEDKVSIFSLFHLPVVTNSMLFTPPLQLQRRSSGSYSCFALLIVLDSLSNTLFFIMWFINCTINSNKK